MSHPASIVQRVEDPQVVKHTTYPRAELYGVTYPFPPAAAQIGKAIAKHGREKFIVATKFGMTLGPEGQPWAGVPDSSPATIRKQVWYQHRDDDAFYVEQFHTHPGF